MYAQYSIYILQKIVLENIRQVVSYISDFEDLFIKQKMESTIKQREKEITTSKKQLSKYQTRVTEIDNLIKHIYEDNISGKLTDERFMFLSRDYENEQKGLDEKIIELNNAIEKIEQEELNVSSFVEKVKKYTEIQELTPEIVNELIDKILVYQQTVVNRKRLQQIDIYYSGVGIISIPTNEYELENAFQESMKKYMTA